MFKFYYFFLFILKIFYTSDITGFVYRESVLLTQVSNLTQSLIESIEQNEQLIDSNKELTNCLSEDEEELLEYENKIKELKDQIKELKDQDRVADDSIISFTTTTIDNTIDRSMMFDDDPTNQDNNTNAILQNSNENTNIIIQNSYENTNTILQSIEQLSAKLNKHELTVSNGEALNLNIPLDAPHTITKDLTYFICGNLNLLSNTDFVNNFEVVDYNPIDNYYSTEICDSNPLPENDNHSDNVFSDATQPSDEDNPNSDVSSTFIISQPVLKVPVLQTLVHLKDQTQVKSLKVVRTTPMKSPKVKPVNTKQNMYVFYKNEFFNTYNKTLDYMFDDSINSNLDKLKIRFLLAFISDFINDDLAKEIQEKLLGIVVYNFSKLGKNFPANNIDVSKIIRGDCYDGNKNKKLDSLVISSDENRELLSKSYTIKVKILAKFIANYKSVNINSKEEVLLKDFFDQKNENTFNLTHSEAEFADKRKANLRKFGLGDLDLTIKKEHLLAIVKMIYKGIKIKDIRNFLINNQDVKNIIQNKSDKYPFPDKQKSKNTIKKKK